MTGVTQLMALDPKQTPAERRQAFVGAAQQFESLFVRTMVQTLRKSAQMTGDADNMFGDGPGADTYSDWFDEKLATQVSKGGHVGIADRLLSDFERWGKVGGAEAKPLPKTGPGNPGLLAPTATGPQMLAKGPSTVTGKPGQPGMLKVATKQGGKIDVAA